MPSINHVHTIVKLKPNWRKCADPHCTYREKDEMVKGKASMCYFCKVNEVILDREQMRRSFARCKDCSMSPEAVKKRKIKEVLQGLGI